MVRRSKSTSCQVRESSWVPQTPEHTNTGDNMNSKFLFLAKYRFIVLGQRIANRDEIKNSLIPDKALNVFDIWNAPLQQNLTSR